MSDYRTRRRSTRRYVRLILEELEWRFVPSLVGVQIDLPLSGILSPLSVPVGSGAASTPAPTTTTLTITSISMPTTASPGTTTASPALEVVSVSFTPTAPGSGLSSAGTTGPGTGVSQPPASASSGGGGSAASVGSTPAFSGGAGQGATGTFAAPSSSPNSFAAAIGIQASFPGSSTVLDQTFSGIDFQFLGNLPSLLGPANAVQGAANTAVSTSSLAGAPLAGSVFARPDLFTDRTTGERSALGLSHPAPGDQEEPLPGQLLIPPDQDWFERMPQNIEQRLPSANFPVGFLKIAPPQLDAVNAPILDAPPAGLPENFIFDEDDTGIPSDDEQPEEEQSGMSAAVAIISFGAGAYWTMRDRRVRRTAADLPVADEEM